MGKRAATSTTTTTNGKDRSKVKRARYQPNGARIGLAVQAGMRGFLLFTGRRLESKGARESRDLLMDYVPVCASVGDAPCPSGDAPTGDAPISAGDLRAQKEGASSIEDELQAELAAMTKQQPCGDAKDRVGSPASSPLVVRDTTVECMVFLQWVGGKKLRRAIDGTHEVREVNDDDQDEEHGDNQDEVHDDEKHQDEEHDDEEHEVTTTTTQCEQDDPCHVTTRLLNDIIETGHKRSRFIERLLPVDLVTASNIPAIVDAVSRVLASKAARLRLYARALVAPKKTTSVDDKKTVTFAVAFRQRNNKEMDKDEVKVRVARAVGEVWRARVQNGTGEEEDEVDGDGEIGLKVNLSRPDITIMVESFIVGGGLCVCPCVLALVPR